MILGQEGLDKRNIYYFKQTNNVIESFTKKKYKKKYLESCGNTSATMGSCMMSKNPLDIEVAKNGIWQCQPEDYLFLHMNDEKNYKKFLAVRKLDLKNKYPGNRVPQYYPVALDEVFNIKCEFVWKATKNYWINTIRNKNVIMICLRKPGHYILLHNFDTSTEEFIFSDPWSSRKGLKNKGFFERITYDILRKNTQGFSIVIFNKRLLK